MSAIANISPTTTRNWAPRNWSLRVKLGGITTICLLVMVVSVGAFLYVTVADLFSQLATQNLERHNQSVTAAIDDLGNTAAKDLLLARQDPAFDEYFLTSDPARRSVALKNIQAEILYLQTQFSIDEICVVATGGPELARCVGGQLAFDLSADESGSPFFAATLSTPNGQVYRSPVPYISPDTHRWVVAHATPLVLPDGTTAGFLHFEIPLVWFQAKLDADPVSGAYSFIMTRDGKLLAHPQLDQIRAAAGFTDAQADFPPADAGGTAGFQGLVSQLKAGNFGQSSFHDSSGSYQTVAQPVFDGNWVIVSVLSNQVVQHQTLSELAKALLLMLLLATAAVTIITSYSNRTVASLAKVLAAATGIAAGNLDQQIDVTSGDEIGQLAASFTAMITYLQTMAAAAERMAAGDLTETITPKSNKDVLGLAFARMIAGLHSAIGQVAGNADSLREAAEQLAAAASQTEAVTVEMAANFQDASAGMRQGAASAAGMVASAQCTTRDNVPSTDNAQAGAISQTAEAMHQLAQSTDLIKQGAVKQAEGIAQAFRARADLAAATQQVLDTTQQVSAETGQAAKAADDGAAIVRGTIQRMSQVRSATEELAGRVRDLGQRSQQIGAIVETIDDIAAQTNLLALNAAIEAARAGEHGHGFAVVADEVRKLAERSSGATKEIAQIVQAVRQGANETAAAMQKAGNDVNEAVTASDRVGSVFGTITGATRASAERVQTIRTALTVLQATGDKLEQVVAEAQSVAAQNQQTTEAMGLLSQTVVLRIASVGTEYAQAVGRVSTATQKMKGQVTEVTASAEALEGMAQALQQIVGQFNLGSDGTEAALTNLSDGVPNWAEQPLVPYGRRPGRGVEQPLAEF